MCDTWGELRTYYAVRSVHGDEWTVHETLDEATMAVEFLLDGETGDPEPVRVEIRTERMTLAQFNQLPEWEGD